MLLTQIAPAQKTVLIEKFSNSHCGNCPNASLIVDEIVEDNPNAIWVTHYKPFTGNPLNNEQSNQLWFDFELWGVPSILVDRRYNNGLFPPQSQWRNVVEEKLQTEQTVSIEISNLVANTFTNELQFDADVKFLSEPSEGEYRISYMIVEDLVTGEPQDNYYNDVEGHPHYGLGNEIWNYKHRNVVRFIADDAWGSQYDELINPNGNTEINGGLLFPIPEEYNVENMFVVCMVSKFNPDNLEDIEVLQAAQLKTTEGIITSSSTPEISSSVTLFPNPSVDYITVKSDEKLDELKIYNAVGQKLITKYNLEKNSSVNVSGLAIGNYTALIRIGNEEIKVKFSVFR